MQAIQSVPRSPATIGIASAVLIGIALLGGVGGYLVRGGVGPTTEHPTSVVLDPLTGYRAGSSDDQRILAFLGQSGYEGGGTVVRAAVDPLTGYPSGSSDDQRILAFLRQSGYEGGGTIAQQG